MPSATKVKAHMTEPHVEQLALALEALGCPKEKCEFMAVQLDKRAKQLAEEKGRSYDEALTHLLNLFRQASQSRPG